MSKKNKEQEQEKINFLEDIASGWSSESSKQGTTLLVHGLDPTKVGELLWEQQCKIKELEGKLTLVEDSVDRLWKK